MKQITVLGGGLVGGLIARDLALEADYEVLLVDYNDAVLRKVKEKNDKIKTERADLSKKESILKVIEGVDLVVGGLPADLGKVAIETVVEAGINYVDISFLEMQFFIEMDEAAKKKGVTVVVDAGIAPGLSSMLCLDAERDLKEVDRSNVYVGGLPVDKNINNWNYFSTWSPADIFEEFTRKALVKLDGKKQRIPSMSFVEDIDLPDAPDGLECFVSDGLRTLVDNSRANSIVEKTIRYKGHVKIFQALIESGFFDEEEVELPGGAKVVPSDLSKYLIAKTFVRDGTDRDCLYMRVKSEGVDMEGKKTMVYYDLKDEMDEEGNSAMSRCTGYVCSAVAKLVLSGLFSKPGVHGPEIVAETVEGFEAVRKSLSGHNLTFKKTVKKL